MTYIAIDASYNSLGYVILSEELGTIELGTLTPQKTDVKKEIRRYDHFSVNSMKIAKALHKILLKYRYFDCEFAIEEIAINGWQRGTTNSVYNLIFEVGTISTMLSYFLRKRCHWIAPTHHKKVLTGNGKASKELSVAHLLRIIPQLNIYANRKLDDVADAFAMTLVLFNKQFNINDYDLIVNI